MLADEEIIDQGTKRFDNGGRRYVSACVHVINLWAIIFVSSFYRFDMCKVPE